MLLREFIEARIADDERDTEIIRCGGYAHDTWHARPTRSGRWVEIYAKSRTLDEPLDAAADEGGQPIALVSTGRAEHAHITRHDPARVMCEASAHRAILAGTSDPTVLLALASIWADHPDYSRTIAGR